MTRESALMSEPQPDIDKNSTKGTKASVILSHELVCDFSVSS